MSTESVMPSNHLILCWPLLLPPSIFHSIRVFSNESVLHIRWPKYWNLSFKISPSNEYSGLTSFRMYWLDLLAVQGTLKSLLQHYSSKASTLRCSAFFIVQLSHPYVTIGKTKAWLDGPLLAKWHLCFLICCLGWSLEKEMATHSSVLAWTIPGTGEPGGLLSVGSHRVGHDWSDLAAAAADGI